MSEAEPQGPKRHTLFEDAQGLATGTAMVTLGVALLQHLGLATGQIAGLSLLVSHWTGFGFGPVFFVLNLPFYWLAATRLGLRFTVKTFLSVALLTLLTTLRPDFLTFGETQPLVGALIAGACAGVGLLAIFRHGASLGGFGILAFYLQERFGFRAGWTQLAVDAGVFALALLSLPWQAVALSLAGAAATNLTIAVNHRRDWYVAM